MGSFYTNITLRGPHQDQIVEALTRQGNRAYVSPTVNEFTVVCDKQCDTQDTAIIHSLAASLSARFECPALAVLNHDDDILWYRLYERGQLVDEYDSSPGCFKGKTSKPAGGNAARLCALMGSQNVEAVASVLHKAQGIKGYIFAIQRHEDLARALGIPIFTVGLGYEYIELGEIPGDLDSESLKRTG
jgi:hypothetical protein